MSFAQNLRPGDARPAPVTLAQFLLQTRAIRPEQLELASTLVTRQKASLGEILLAEGAIDPETLIRAQAFCYGMARVDATRVDVIAQYVTQLGAHFCLKHALCPVIDQTTGAMSLVLARPEQLETLLPQLPTDLQNCPLQLGTEPEVHNLIAAHARTELTQAASARVPEIESCRTWHRFSRLRLPATLVVIAVVLAAFLLAPTESFGALVFWACLTLLIATTQKAASLLSFLSARNSVPATRPSDGRLPKVSILVPLFREREVAGALVARLSRLIYPKSLLDIILVLEEKDDITRDAVAQADLPHWIRVVVVPDGAPKTKPRAMNYALDFCRGEIIGIYDAEDAPAPDQIDRVVDRFAHSPEKMVCLQGVLDYYNPKQNWLARCFTIEYATWFRVMLPGMTRLGFAIPLGGTTLFFRRDVLEELGGWDAHNVTEDADLGFRLARHGYQTGMIATTTGEEANCHLVPWIKQRSRWLKGYMVTYLVHMRAPLTLCRQMGLWRFIGFQTHFVTALSQFMLAPFLWSFWLVFFGLPHPLDGVLPHWALLNLARLFVAVELITLTAGVVAIWGRDHRHLLPWLPSIHFYFPLGVFAAYKALYELIFAPFYWDKTQHGHSLAQITPIAKPPSGNVRIQLQPGHESL